ncbi:MAG: hypothetical protein DSY60_01000 [Persephonella sp.]|nr:MAG: hypothetical protein DSY60_01000 [Persephonella sp.]
MKILQVIHGFPPYYMAGSEVYTYNLTNELSKNNEVFIFTRIENPFMKPFETIEEKIKNLNIYRINNPTPEYSIERKYLNKNIDKIFEEFLAKIKPDIVHIQHLSHLSTNIVNIVKDYNIPIVFTIHDFWMFCLRGQLLTRDYQICKGPDEKECISCLWYLNTNEQNFSTYKKHMEEIINKINIFLAPSKTVRDFFIRNGINENKVILSKYGFDKTKIKYRRKRFEKNQGITFGFVGRIIPAKGIHILIEAFNRTKNKNNSVLKIFGSLGNLKTYLESLAGKNIYFMGGFNNEEIDKILDEIDILVVPSIWYENSPLVIQEAFLKGIPVITSNIGGMAELVEDGKNGFLFKIGDIEDLKNKTEMIMENPTILNNLDINPKEVRDIKEDAKSIQRIYEDLLCQN